VAPHLRKSGSLGQERLTGALGNEPAEQGNCSAATRPFLAGSLRMGLVAELGNNSVGVIDLNKGEVIRNVTGQGATGRGLRGIH
jgi:hypothetical protein